MSGAHPAHTQFCVLQFDKTVTCPASSVLLGSRFDSDIHLNTCRLAFAGRLLTRIDFDNTTEREKLRVYKRKERSGVVDRVVDGHSLIGKDLFKKDSDMNRYIGMQVALSVNGTVFVDRPTSTALHVYGLSYFCAVVWRCHRSRRSNREFVRHWREIQSVLPRRYWRG